MLTQDVRSHLQAQMRTRLQALVRKAKVPDTDADAALLLATLTRLLTSKKEYERALGEEESAAAFCKQHALPEKQARIFMAMQRQKDIYTPNALLDALMTGLFLLQVVIIVYEMWGRNMLGLFAVLCIAIDALVFRVKAWSEWIGGRLSDLVADHGLVDERPLAAKIQLKKWQEQTWQLVVHASASLFEIMILSDEEWWSKPETSWVPHPFEQRGKFRTDLQVFYMAQLAVWMYTCFVHRFVDERRKDYFVMYLHHIASAPRRASRGERACSSACTERRRLIRARALSPFAPRLVLAPALPPPRLQVTIALVGLSWACGYMRVGLLVLFVHDFSDIFVDLLKMVNYLKLENRRGLFASEIAYIVCVLSWVYFRLYEFPFRVVRGSLTVPYTLLLRTPRESYSFLGLEFFPSDLPWHFHLNVMLFALLLLHIYWFHLFLMIGYRILTESAREASRQEYEGDSDEEEETAKGQIADGGAAAGAGAGAGAGAADGGAAVAAIAAAAAAAAAEAAASEPKRGAAAARKGGASGRGGSATAARTATK